jgi:predicted glycogen debranching enzyme
MPTTSSREWLEADGLGGFAMGTASGIRTRRYHALLLAAITPPTGRFALVNGLDVAVETSAGAFALSSQCYAPGVLHPDGAQRVEGFDHEPWPTWIFRLEDGTRVQQELFVVKGQPVVCLAWKLLGSNCDVKLRVRPFLSGRDYHAMHKANGAFQFDAEIGDGRVGWAPYPGVPGVVAFHNGAYTHQPGWYYNFLYEEEQARGLDCTEDLAVPGVIEFNLGQSEAVLVLTTKENAKATYGPPPALWNEFRAREARRREEFPTPLERAADAYLVRRAATGRTIIAGYPWFTDWGRDTFIALRGLCLATRRWDDARAILLEWAGAVSEGMLPNRFSDHGETPEFNAADASLWFILAAHEYLETGHASGDDRQTLRASMEAILDGYARGTRFRIQLDAAGLLAAGEPGVQLTWMDAKVGDWVVTPRIGKPVEVQALWLNALWCASRFDQRWIEPLERGARAFRQRFWNAADGCLFDVVDVNHQAGVTDASFRPNQILAVGGRPYALLDGAQARQVVDAVEQRLWTPLGLRSLAPGEVGYAARYHGGVRERDGAYHQGTVWPWLAGPFVEAWVRVRGNTAEARRTARKRFVEPLRQHLDEAGLGHLSEIACAEAPHTPCGCPFQAWSVGELLRLEHKVLAEPKRKPTLRTKLQPAHA